MELCLFRAVILIVLAVLCTPAGFQGLSQGREGTVLLDRDDVWLIVINVPEVIELEARKGCPDVEIKPQGS
jgi:hypothetical protein